MMNKYYLPLTALLLGVSAGSALAEEQANYHNCLFDDANQSQAEQAGQTLAIYCASRHFDTAPTAFQAQVLLQDLDGMKQRDPKFREFYDTVRKNSGNDIYTDRQIVLMYIDKREVNKD
jgi:peptidase E